MPIDKDIDNEEDKLHQFGTLITDLMKGCLFGESLVPVRGGISVGNVITGTETDVRNRSFVSGRALLEAYKYEERQNWMGISFYPISAMHRQAYCDKITSSKWYRVNDMVIQNLSWNQVAICLITNIPPLCQTLFLKFEA